MLFDNESDRFVAFDHDVDGAFTGRVDADALQVIEYGGSVVIGVDRGQLDRGTVSLGVVGEGSGGCRVARRLGGFGNGGEVAELRLKPLYLRVEVIDGLVAA